MRFNIRPMTEADIEGIMLVETASFSIPWSEKSFYDELKNPVAVYFVAECDGRVAGYIGMWDISGEGDITNVAVLPEFRGMGAGGSLLRAMISECKKRGLSYLTLEVRCSNAVAISMYKSFGFKNVGTRKKYYADNGEDAIIMTLELEESFSE